MAAEKWKELEHIDPADIPNEIIVEVHKNNVIIVAQKPPGTALTIRDFRAKDTSDFITHYGADYSVKTVATFINPTITDVEVTNTGDE